MGRMFTDNLKAIKIGEQLEALHEELSVLSRKKPDNAVNEFKLLMINQVLSEINLFLDDNHRPFNDFTIFNKDNMPTNSDVVLILAQYIKCFNRQKLFNR